MKSTFSLVLVMLLIGFSNFSLAKPLHFNRLKSHFSEFKEVKKRKCQNCHSKRGLRLNPFGQDYASLINDFETVEEALMALEDLDSDEDGVSNIEELIEGTNPGDPES